MRALARAVTLGQPARAWTNAAVLRAARGLAPASPVLTLYNGVGGLPLFNPDDERSLPAAALALREALGRSDAVLMACLEYAHGVLGAFKNLLDWPLGSLKFPGKPVALLNTSDRGSHYAQAALREVLITMSALLIEAACITGPTVGRRLRSCDRACRS